MQARPWDDGCTISHMHRAGRREDLFIGWLIERPTLVTASDKLFQEGTKEQVAWMVGWLTLVERDSRTGQLVSSWARCALVRQALRPRASPWPWRTAPTEAPQLLQLRRLLSFATECCFVLCVCMCVPGDAAAFVDYPSDVL